MKLHFSKISFPFFAINLVLRAFLIVNHQQNLWVKIAGITYLGYGVACVILIPLYNYLGLAYARLLTEIVLFAMIFLYIHKSIYRIPIIKIGTAPVISCSISIAVFYSMANISLWLRIPCALTVCIMTMFLLKGIQIHDFFLQKNCFSAM